MKKRSKLAFLAVLVAAGCGPPSLQEETDPAQAREGLRTALDAWQRGESPDALRSASPAIQAADHDWTAGTRLKGYQIVSDGKRAGIEMSFRVVLTLQQPNGKTIRKNVAYTVGTRPALTVHREDNE